jgi:hypothetical protein
MSTVFENGMTAIAAIAVIMETTGASTKTQPTELRGRNCSLKTSLPMSAMGCSAP